MKYRTADLISSAISLPLVIATFIAALLGSFTSWVMYFLFHERIWDKIVKPDTDVDLTDRIEMREREGKETDVHLHFEFLIHSLAQCPNLSSFNF